MKVYRREREIQIQILEGRVCCAVAAYLHHQQIFVCSPHCCHCFQTAIRSCSCSVACGCRVPPHVTFPTSPYVAAECIPHRSRPAPALRMEASESGSGVARRFPGCETDHRPASDCCAKQKKAQSMEEVAAGRFCCLVKVGRAAFAEKDIATVVVVPSWVGLCHDRTPCG
jgi:hypothetical protein